MHELYNLNWLFIYEVEFNLISLIKFYKFKLIENVES